MAGSPGLLSARCTTVTVTLAFVASCARDQPRASRALRICEPVINLSAPGPEYRLRHYSL